MGLMSRYGTPVLRAIAWVGVVLCWDGLCSAAENLVVVPTELKVSSVGVALRAPLGFRYRAGEAFPLEIQVSNPGSAMDAEIEISEGDGREWAERAMNAVPVTLSAGTSRVMLPMRAPGISAAVVLVIRGGVPGAAKAELFRSTLSRVLHPLASG
ncbi:MAG: hypothetical protein WCT04_22100, partial [Planctomycetota bacterium]